MLGRICDRCGKVTPTLSDDKRTYMSLVDHDNHRVERDKLILFNGKYKHVDLCDECVKSLKEWFEKKVHE